MTSEMLAQLRAAVSILIGEVDELDGRDPLLALKLRALFSEYDLAVSQSLKEAA